MKTKKILFQNNSQYSFTRNFSASSESSIILVSGLPRSGTSMMMQMLEAGGIKLIVDHIRKADEDNPKGYYEFEKIKRLDKDSSWLESAYGKAVKVISMLLYQLPEHNFYKIIFMKREMNEILASQNKMLKRKNEPSCMIDDRIMAEKFNEHLKKIFNWLNKQENIQILFISYNDVISNPTEQAWKINRFLGTSLDVEKMVTVVDSSLYRQKNKNDDHRK